MAKRIYFDHSATTPLDPRVALAMQPANEELFGNPSSLHSEGRQAQPESRFASKGLWIG